MATTLNPQSPLEIIEDVLKVIKTQILIGKPQNIQNSCATASESSTNTATTMSKSKLQKERRLAKSLKRSARKKRKKLEKTKAMEFEETEREEEGTDTDTDINYNIILNNAFKSLRSDPEEPPEMTPETIVKL